MGLSNVLVLVLELSLTFMIIIIKASYGVLSLDNLSHLNSHTFFSGVPWGGRNDFVWLWCLVCLGFVDSELGEGKKKMATHDLLVLFLSLIRLHINSNESWTRPSWDSISVWGCSHDRPLHDSRSPERSLVAAPTWENRHSVDRRKQKFQLVTSERQRIKRWLEM